MIKKNSCYSSKQRKNEEGWGIVLVFFMMAFLIGITLVAVRQQMSGMRELGEHDTAHDEYWRANACAIDLEASLRSDLVSAFNQEATQARIKERADFESSRLPVFDPVGTPVSVPLMTFSPDDGWLDVNHRLRVPEGTLTNCKVSDDSADTRPPCTSLLGRLGEMAEAGTWLARHVALTRAYASRRGHPTKPKVDDVLVLRETFPREFLATSDYGFDQTNYIIEFVVETTTSNIGEEGRVRRQGRITLGSPPQIIPICHVPQILDLTRTPPDPVEEGMPLTFSWKTLDAQAMRIEILNPDDSVKTTRDVPLTVKGEYFAQTGVDNLTVATIDDPDALSGIMKLRFTAIAVCATKEVRLSLPVTLTISVKRILIRAWAAPWSRPSGEGLRASDRFGDIVGFFQTWAEARTSGDRVKFKVRVGFTMGNEKARKLKNDIPVRKTFIGTMTLTDTAGNIVESMNNLALSQSPNPPISWKYRFEDLSERTTLFMAAPTRGCDSGYCAAGAPVGSVLMGTEYSWDVPRPKGKITGYRLSFNFDVRTIDPFRSDHRLYSRRGGTDKNPIFPMTVNLLP